MMLAKKSLILIELGFFIESKSYKIYWTLFRFNLGVTVHTLFIFTVFFGKIHRFGCVMFKFFLLIGMLLSLGSQSVFADPKVMLAEESSALHAYFANVYDTYEPEKREE